MTTQLHAHLVHHTQAARADRVTEALEPAIGIDGLRAVAIEAPVEDVLPGLPARGAYCASKFAMESALETLAIEVAQFGIRVAIIEPGLTFAAAQSKGQSWSNNTAYAATYRRTGAVFSAEAAEGSSSELVAEAIAAALADPQPRLRYLVGADARRNIASRARVSDERWGALHGIARSEDFYARWAQVFGVDPTPRDGPRGGPRGG